ncbi:RimK family alpha-L-glutamate ligase [Candidatus Bathyarchaeota archaeon]|nr:RimK family alpha-L-glutamate ligase [Candidatus Bathyarchaeota archaeon]MBS7629034.1 RimK family alpha-L-glutamate ligase [Candidatus Bathyarchaeota archaeon]
MRIGLLTRNRNAWCSQQLIKSFKNRGANIACFSFGDIVARVGLKPIASVGNIDLLTELDAILVRPIGRGSLEEIIFRLNLLQKLARSGLTVINSPSSIEKAADKYNTLAILSEHDINVPRTVVTENVARAMDAFKEFGEDVVVKPIFGSRGIGAARVSNYDVAERVFRTLRFQRQILYIQEYIWHGTSDIRAFVVGDNVAGAMRRVADSWKTNISKGAKALPISLSQDLEKLAVKAAKAIGCEIAGVDLIDEGGKPAVLEINSQPGWRGLQTVTDKSISDTIADYVISRAS